VRQYVPVGNFEQQTGICPTYIAWIILDEARNYFRADMPEGYADELAGRAETVLACQPFWQRKYQGPGGCEHLRMSMRHWLAGVLAREKPAWFRELPEIYKVGLPLPPEALSRPGKIRRRGGHSRRSNPLVHGAELLMA
jgi:hypothetical protein